MAKINTKNVALILGMTAFDLGVGFYDRVVNGIGVIDWLLKLNADLAPMASKINTANMTLSGVVTNTGTAFNFLALGLFVIGAVFVISIIAGTLGSRGGMM